MGLAVESERRPRRTLHLQTGLVARYGLGARVALVFVVVIVAMSAVSAVAHAAPAEATNHDLHTQRHGARMTTPAPADAFMQALITHNGQLAWKQLCPTLQQKLSASDLANLLHATGAPDQGLQLGVDFVGAHPWADGGEVRIYVVTAHGPPGTEFRSLYVVRTQASGCIDGILSG